MMFLFQTTYAEKQKKADLPLQKKQEAQPSAFTAPQGFKDGVQSVVTTTTFVPKDKDISNITDKVFAGMLNKPGATEKAIEFATKIAANFSEKA